MTAERIHTVVVGAGQAGLAMSEHLSRNNIQHLILERDRIAERWRSARWDNLVANGPAWHDRFPSLEFTEVDVGDDDFPSKDEVTSYFEVFAEKIKAPIRCGVNVISAERHADGLFHLQTSEGEIIADHVVAATGPFQIPIIPSVVPETSDLTQIHSFDYKRADQLEDGGVLVIGAGSSGSQIADELSRSGRDTYLAIGPHDRPPRRYRGKDFVWWLGVLGKWQMKTPPAGREHVTIAVSGAYGGHTIDFRRFAEQGITLLGMAGQFQDGVLSIAPDLVQNIAAGDENLLELLAEADRYIADNNLDFPLEEDLKIIRDDPECLINPILELDLVKRGIKTIIWATGYKQDFSWLKADSFDETGKPLHHRGVGNDKGIYFIGLPWLSMRGSSFIWGVYEDARYLADTIAQRSGQDNSD